jgi:hypothetical protein
MITHPGRAPSQNVSVDHRERLHKIDTTFWADIMIVAGAAILAGTPWGWFLVALGILVVGTQIVRWQMDLPVESFWAACGLFIILSGAWELLALPWSVAPVLLIVIGVALLWKVVRQ